MFLALVPSMPFMEIYESQNLSTLLLLYASRCCHESGPNDVCHDAMSRDATQDAIADCLLLTSSYKRMPDESVFLSFPSSSVIQASWLSRCVAQWRRSSSLRRFSIYLAVAERNRSRLILVFRRRRCFSRALCLTCKNCLSFLLASWRSFVLSFNAKLSLLRLH